MPSTMSLVITSPCSLRCHQHRLGMRIGCVLVDAPLDLGPHVANEALDWPSRRVAERADGLPLDLHRDFEQHIDLALLRPALSHARDHPPHPTGALTTGRALAARLVLVEIRN